MGAIGDVASALAPAAQGLTQGQLAAGQEQIQNQQYMNSLNLQKQQASLQAKHFDLAQQQFQHQKTQDAVNAGLGMLKDIDSRLDNPANWQTPDSQAEKVHLQQLRSNLAGAVSNASKSGDPSGIFDVLSAAENHVQTNGTIVGLPPHPAAAAPADQSAQQGTQPATPNAPTQAAAIPPEVMQMLSQLVPQPMQQAVTQQLQQPAAQAPASGPPAFGPPPPPGSLQTTAGTVVPGAPFPAGAQPLAPGVQPAPTTPTPRQDIINNPEMMTPTPAPGPITSSGYQNLTPGLESAIVSSRARTQALIDRLNPDNAVQQGNETATAFQARKDAALDRIDKLQTQQATYEKNILDPYFKQMASYQNNLEKAADRAQKQTQAELQSRTSISVAQIAAGGRARELALQGARLTEQQQKDALMEGNNAFKNEIVQNRAIGVQRLGVLRQEAQQAIQSLPREIQSNYTQGGGGLNIGLPDLGIGLRGNLQAGTTTTLQGGRQWTVTPQVAQYLADKSDFERFQRQENQYWQPRDYKQLTDSQRDNPAHVALVQTALNGDTSRVVNAFQRLAATDNTKGQAYHLLQVYQQAYPDRELPPGMDYAELRGIHHPAAPANSAPAGSAAPISATSSTPPVPKPVPPPFKIPEWTGHRGLGTMF